MATAKIFSPKALAGMLEKDPQSTLANLKLDHDIAALMLVAESPYFKSLPEGLRGQEACLAAIGHCAEAAARIPPRERTPEVCLAAVKKSGLNLDRVPPELQTAEMARIAAEDGYFWSVLDKFKTPELCKAALRAKNNRALGSIPESMVTPELCLEAVRHSRANLPHVPGSMLTVEMCLEAARGFWLWAEAVPHEFRPEAYMAIVRQNGWQLEHVPKESLTPELCLEAVRQVGEKALDRLPAKMCTPELYEAAKEAMGDLSRLPDSLKTPEICLEAVRKRGSQLRYVPDRLKTPEMCRLAVMDNDELFLENLSLVPESLKTPELCLLAVERSRSSGVIKHVPLGCMSKELLGLCARKGDSYVKELPHSVVTDELLCSAVWRDSSAVFLEQFGITLKTLCHYLLSMHIHNTHEPTEKHTLRAYYPNHAIPPRDKNSRNAAFWFLLALCGYKSALPGDIDISGFLKQAPQPQAKAAKVKKVNGTRHLIKALEDAPSAICRLKGLDEDAAALIKAAGHPCWDFIPEELKTLRTLVLGSSPGDLALQHGEALCAEAYWQCGTRRERKDLLRLLPDSEKTPAMAWDALHHHMDTELLRLLPERLFTDEFIAAFRAKVVFVSPFEWPEALLCDADYEFALDGSPMDLERVPDSRKTPTLCMRAVQQDGRALQFVPEGLVTEEMCLLALWTASLKDIRSFIPDRLMAGELEKAVHLLGGSGKLGKLAKSKRTGAIWRSLAMAEPHTLQDNSFPEGLRTIGLCLDIAACDGSSLQNVPEGLRTKEVCEAAVASWPGALEHVPVPLRTPELCLSAVSRRGDMLECVPEALKTEELCLVAARAGCSLADVPERLRTAELCALAVERSPGELQNVPDGLKTMELCLKAGWSGVCFIPERLQGPEFFSAWIKSGRGLLCYVPEDMRTEQMYLEALAHGDTAPLPDSPVLTPRLALEYLRKDIAGFHSILYESPFILEALTLMRKRGQRIPVKKEVENPDYWFAIGLIHGSAKVPASIPAGRYALES